MILLSFVVRLEWCLSLLLFRVYKFVESGWIFCFVTIGCLPILLWISIAMAGLLLVIGGLILHHFQNFHS